MSDRAEIFETVTRLIEPFNKKGIALTESTSFAKDLEWDSLTVMDFVAAVEDEFDIIITMNMQAEIETIGQLADAVKKLVDSVITFQERSLEIVNEMRQLATQNSAEIRDAVEGSKRRIARLVAQGQALPLNG